jgi:hypothetical protein
VTLVAIHATVNIGSIKDMLGRIARIDTRKVFNELKGPMRFDERHHWRKSEAPDGKWPPLAPSTQERRTRPRGRDKNGKNRSWPTRLLGRFPTALQILASKKSLIARSRIKRFDYIHQAGGIAGHGAKIPRRQYLWISDFLTKETKRYFERAMARAAARR